MFDILNRFQARLILRFDEIFKISQKQAKERAA
jgi:hypothetical protein